MRKNSFSFLDFRKDVYTGLNHIRRLLSWTIVKEYQFQLTEHFIERCLERNFPLAFILNLAYIILSEHRYLFRNDGDYLFKCSSDYLVVKSVTTETGDRLVVMKTVFESNGKHVPGKIVEVSRKYIMEIKL